MASPLIAIGGGLAASAGATAFAATQKPKVAKRDYRSELLSNIGAQLEALPQFFKGLQEWAPKFGQLQAQQISTIGKDIVESAQTATGTRGIIDELLRQTQQELEAGPDIDPALQRVLTQRVRAGLAARGLGLDLPGVGAETAVTADVADMLRQRRKENAIRALGTASSFANLLSLGLPSSVPLLNPESAYARSVYGGNVAAQNLANQQIWNRNMALSGGILSLGGRIAGIGLKNLL